ncbi:MAG: LCP family protein [Lachnospiraceae bacterium]|nr:LCP family protein [Lachnospiraceae bacterium]
MNKDTHEQEIEVELLNPEEIETQEEETDLSALTLDGDLIEELYQEQQKEQQNSDETSHTEGKQAEKIVLPDLEEPDGTDIPERIYLEEETASVPDSLTAEGVAAGESAEKEMSAETAGAAGESKAAKSIASEGTDSTDPIANVSTAEDATVIDTAAIDEILSEEEEDSELPETSDANLQETADAESIGGEGEKPKKKKSVLRKILKGVLITFEVLILALIVYVVAIIVQADSTTDLISRLSQSLLGKAILSAAIEEEYESNVQETIASEQISTNEGLDVETYTLEGDYTSFVIFGVDARGDEFDSGTNSDTIIIVTIQNETGRVRMASIYRDTYLQIESSDGGVHYAKANSAYSSGGAVRALNMLNTNFDLALEDYVVVNFAGVADIIDELGGLDIYLSEGEVSQLNTHLKSSISATGLTADKITSAGWNHLNGVQALTYARIRKTAFTDPETGEVYNNDYGRTKRQQYVISLLAAKAKEASVSELIAIVNRVFSYNTDEEKVIGTTYAFDDIISMIPLALTFTLDGGEGYPDNKTTMVMSDLNGADCVIATDLVSDVSALHEFLYDEENYSPTGAVRNIADTILDRAATYGTED